MKKLYWVFALAMLSSVINAQELQSCADIKDSKARLACYDKTIEKSKQVNEDKIGLPSKKPAEALPKEINTHIVGPFRGWKNGQVLILANGQEWKVVSRTSGYVKLDSPKIQITEGVWGSFDIKVEGFNVQGKVRRIK
ncbi:hypothetical protein ACUR5C_02040 [Aliikangiella sp. IMCC44653]